ncbi:MAG: hypothetical protein V9E81_12475 [Marmoricola sp.]
MATTSTACSAVDRYDLGDADDVAAVLRHRLRLATSDAGRRSRRPARLIGGLIPEAIGPMAPDMRNALDERKTLIEQRAKTLAETAIRRRESWIQLIGDAPAVDRPAGCAASSSSPPTATATASPAAIHSAASPPTTTRSSTTPAPKPRSVG